MSRREDKAVAVEPFRVLRVVLEELLPEHVGHWRGTHRQPGVAGIGGLDGVDGERANRVDGEGFERGVGSSGCGHERLLGE